MVITSPEKKVQNVVDKKVMAPLPFPKKVSGGLGDEHYDNKEAFFKDKMCKMVEDKYSEEPLFGVPG